MIVVKQRESGVGRKLEVREDHHVMNPEKTRGKKGWGTEDAEQIGGQHHF